MESVLDFLCGIFMTMFWIFRIVIAALVFLEIEVPISIPYLNVEIVILFITLICILCVFKRKMVGGIIYFLMYAGYFGFDLFNIIRSNGVASNIASVGTDFIAIILAAMIILNIIISKMTKISRKNNTDWFYDGKQYDRKLDERADKNNYRIY